jgi:hypothetical protein
LVSPLKGEILKKYNLYWQVMCQKSKKLGKCITE